MQVNPYLFFNGNCEEALNYYQKALGAQIEAKMPYGDGPAEMPIPADWKTKIMHSMHNPIKRSSARGWRNLANTTQQQHHCSFCCLCRTLHGVI